MFSLHEFLEAGDHFPLSGEVAQLLINERGQLTGIIGVGLLDTVEGERSLKSELPKENSDVTGAIQASDFVMGISPGLSASISAQDGARLG